MIRVGTGYDVHRLVKDRKLILGGEEIEYEFGLLGHSDADVLTHAIMDSLLGAAALGDIGSHFPDTDNSYKGANSIGLLKRVKDILFDNSYEIVNVDATVVAQMPKLKPHIDAMRSNIADALDLNIEFVSIKATTTEKLGFEGEGLGISAQAVCLIKTRGE